jgi:hypothetical protein
MPSLINPQKDKIIDLLKLPNRLLVEHPVTITSLLESSLALPLHGMCPGLPSSPVANVVLVSTVD